MAQTDINTPSRQYQEREPDWKLIETLLGGTRAMRKAAKTYLPQEPAEDNAAYQSRLARSVLFNAFKSTLVSMAGKPFKKTVTLKDPGLPQLDDYSYDVDLRGNNLTVFAHKCFKSLLAYGSTHIFIDYPVIPEGSTLEMARSLGARPYFIHLDATRIIGCRVVYEGGQPVLNMVRIRETYTVESPDGNDIDYPQVRVLYPGRFEIWRQETKRKKWVIVDEGETSLGVIPLVTITVDDDDADFITAEPPLLPLAELNVEHWQSSSDQRHILHVARVPILFASGFHGTQELVIGANSLVKATDPAAQLRFVEHGGAAIGAGKDDIKAIEDRMAIMGLQMLTPKEGSDMTATQSANDAQNSDSHLALMCQRLQDGLSNAFGFMCLYEGGDFFDSGLVEVWKEFGIAGSLADLQYLLTMRQSPEITRETFLTELKRRGFMAEDFDVDAEIDNMDIEQASLPGFGDDGSGEVLTDQSAESPPPVTEEVT
jgi:hypothetical protein